MHGIEVLTLREGAISFTGTAVSIVLGTANGRKNWSIPLCGNDSRFSLVKGERKIRPEPMPRLDVVVQ